VAEIGRGALAEAEPLLKQVLAAQPGHPIALYLEGVIAFERSQWAEAENRFRQALVRAPGQPKVTLHLAQALRAQGKTREAALLCRQVLALAPADHGALLELGKAEEESGDLAAAETTWRRLLGLGFDAVATVNLAQLLARTERSEEARTLLARALEQPQLEPAVRARLAHQMGVIFRLERDYENAFAWMMRAGEYAPPSREERMERSGVLQHLGRISEAIRELETILAADPLDQEVHIGVNEILLRHDPSRFLSSYDKAIAAVPGAPELAVEKGRMLLRAKKPGEAVEAFRIALKIAPGHASAHSWLGRALEQLGERDKAAAAHAEAAKRAPEESFLLQEYAGFLLRRGLAGEATDLAEKAVALRPFSQNGLSLLGLCYRAGGDGREEWLNDYERHIAIIDLEPPPGFSDMENFNAELKAYLDRQHGNAREYLTQTLRGGTQTHEDMFNNGHKLADRLLPRINEAIRNYVAGWRADARHPLAGRRGSGFRYNGSWSSRLADCGFHVNHIHHKGWISSCYYVALPDVVEDEKARQGWIKFGEAPEEYGGAFAPRRAIQPRPGRLVLFPSYMWHGTIPFHAPQNRITIAFDAVPV
jgi:tetratricopeptide (TPR) repeat protein